MLGRHSCWDAPSLAEPAFTWGARRALTLYLWKSGHLTLPLGALVFLSVKWKVWTMLGVSILGCTVASLDFLVFNNDARALPQTTWIKPPGMESRNEYFFKLPGASRCSQGGELRLGDCQNLSSVGSAGLAPVRSGVCWVSSVSSAVHPARSFSIPWNVPDA